MTTRYIHGTTGSDAASGLTSALAKKTIAATLAAASANDTILWAESTRECGVSSTLDGLLIMQEPGQPQAILRGDTLATSWTIDGGAYYASYVAVNGVQGGVVDYDASVTAEGFHYGHLTGAASKVLCQGTDNTIFQDTVANRFYVRIGANLNPAGFTVGLCDVLGKVLLTLSGANCVVNGIHFWLNPRTAVTADSYMLYMLGLNPTIINCKAQDCGSHAWDVNDATGNKVLNNNMASGCHDGTYTVFGSVTPGNLIDKAHNISETYYPRGYLLRDGTEMAGTGAPICAYQHPGGGGNVTDVEYRDCNFNGVARFAQGAHVGYDTGTDVADGDRWTSGLYPVRVIGGVTTDNIEVHPFKSMTYVRHKFLSFPGRQGAAGSGGIVLDGNGTGSASIYFECCVIIGDLTQTNNGAEGVLLWTNDGNSGHKIILNNCTVIDTSTQAPGADRYLYHVFGDADFEARRCIFAHRTSHAKNIFGKYDDGAGTVVDVKDCLYLNMATYSAVASRDTAAEWFATMDTDGTVARNVLSGTPFVSWTTGQLDITHPAWKLRTVNTEHLPATGVDGAPFARFYGAYQGNQPTDRFRSDASARLSRARR